MGRLCAIVLALLLAARADATIRIVTSLPELADVTRRIGGDRVTTDFIVRGDQNPHFVEVKPSYMMKLKSADLFIEIGMELELWAPPIIDGSRNTRLTVIDLSQGIQKLEVPSRLDASQGDVHRYGNPHYWLDPRNMRIIVREIVDALTAASPSDGDFFKKNGDAYRATLDAKIKEWEGTMKPLAGRRIITFHKSWSYFADWLGLIVADQVEPKPGIAPSPSHTADLIRLVRQGNIKAIIVEPYYDTSAADQIAGSTAARVIRLQTSAGAGDASDTYVGMMDYNISTLAAALR